MIKKILSLVCATIMLFCVACNKNKTSEKESVALSDVEQFLQVVQKVEDAQSFYCIAEGQTKSLGVKQQISARRYVNGDTMFKESISYSKLVKVATQVYVANGKYLIRESHKVNSITSVLWQGHVTDIGQEEYNNRYGSVILGLNNFIINKDVITSLTLTESENGKVFVVNLNVDTATKNMVKEMKTNASSKSEPTFSVVKFTVTTNSSLEVVSVRYESVYKVEIAVLGNVECEEDMTEYFYGFNQTNAFDEQSFFEKYL